MPEAALETSEYPTLFGAPEGHDARILAERARGLMPQDKAAVHIALDMPRIITLKELLHFFAPDVEVVIFPAWDCLPYDRVSPNHELIAQRVSALSQMMSWQDEARRIPRVILTSVNAALQKTMPRDVLKKSSFSAKSGGALNQKHLQEFLSANGYLRAQTVREAGEYAMRGGIIDIFPTGYEKPVRLDLFGDDIESIKTFDTASQMSERSIDHFSLLPATEFFLDEESITRFRQNYREAFGAVRGDDPLYEAVSEGRRFAGMEHWLPLFYDEMGHLSDYIPGGLSEGSISLDHHAPQAIEERAAQIDDFYNSRKIAQKAAQNPKNDMAGSIYHPLAPAQLYDMNAGILAQASVLSPFNGPEQGGIATAKKIRDFADIRAMPDGDVFDALKEYLSDFQDRKRLIACYSDGARQRMEMLLGGAGIENMVRCDDPQALKKLRPDQIGLSVLHLEHGFIADDLIVLSEQDILGERLMRSAKKRKKADNFLTEVSSLSEGDLVVHVDHGVGRFVSLETLEAAGRVYDCLKVEYDGGDKLYVPVINMEVLSRFGNDEGTAQLDKLGGAGWQARKSRVKKDLMVMADGLLKIAAERTLRKAEKLDISNDLYQEFAARFPYEETEDQERAINDTLADLSGEMPMDRLVCGDVGFGKTEIAIRAAYVAAMAGAQVALVAPTTLLVRQHYQNFMARFSGTSLRIEQLSRLVKPSDAKGIKEGLADGSVNIVIGTHALFAKDVKFDHLGLMIVDEEQRFGVKQKERLKELKTDVHVLTLTATPIPRTLQMALTSVKEMSLITTPPVDRLAIQSFVMPLDSHVIREALRRERDRGGQSFYVVPRIKDIPDIEDMLKDIVPEMKVIVAHGQMPGQELEERMSAFYDGRYDILLATNIIESGIDIPSANTMIVHRSDLFGLSQLYQIRGRIGRSKLRAYAYLTYRPQERLTQLALKRLEIMETLDTLGAGFQLASHDMDLRGSGNLLGDQQSGHVKEVGVELYQQMLEEAVAAAREGLDFEKVEEESFSPQINIGTSVLIPDHYVEDLGIRMSLYRRLSDLGNRPPSSPRRFEETQEQRGSSDVSGKAAAPIDLVRASASEEVRQRDDDFDCEIESFAAEMIDRFGDLPSEVQNLLDLVTIKMHCRMAGVSEVEAGPKGAVIAFHQNNPPNLQGLMGWMQEQKGSVKLRPDQKLALIRGWDNLERRVKGVQRVVKELADLVD